MQISIAAAWALMRNALLMTAMVTAQPALSQMHHQTTAAARAGRYPMAGGAQQHRRITTAINKQ